MSAAAAATIDTARLHLRPHRLEDFDALHAMFADPAVLAPMGRAPLSGEDVWNRLLRYIGHWHALDYGLFAIIERDSGAFLGETGFADFHRGLGPRFDGVPEAGWILRTQAHGRGIAAEAVGAAHAWLDARHSGGARSVCCIGRHNLPSQRVAAGAGYHPFGEARYHDQDVVLYERTRETH